MIFQHELVERVHMPRKEIDGLRHYVLPDGTALKSVTTVLGERLDHSGLDDWRARVGVAEAKRIGDAAAARGTIVHGIAERFLMNDPAYARGVMPTHLDTFLQLKRALQSHVSVVFGIEIPLYARALKAAGTCDLVAEYDGINSIVDFKTSTRIKDESWIEGYFLQTTAYSLMFQAMYKIEIPQIVIMIASDAIAHGEAQIFVRNRADYVKRVIEVFT